MATAWSLPNGCWTSWPARKATRDRKRPGWSLIWPTRPRPTVTSPRCTLTFRAFRSSPVATAIAVFCRTCPPTVTGTSPFQPRSIRRAAIGKRWRRWINDLWRMREQGTIRNRPGLRTTGHRRHAVVHALRPRHRRRKRHRHVGRIQRRVLFQHVDLAHHQPRIGSFCAGHRADRVRSTLGSAPGEHPRAQHARPRGLRNAAPFGLVGVGRLDRQTGSSGLVRPAPSVQPRR